MIDHTSLDRLREADPETWKRFDETELFTYHEYDDYGTTKCYVYQEDVIDIAREAWLQHVLQEAIQISGWDYHISGDKNTSLTKIEKFDGINIYPTITASGDSPVESLLRAYLEAIKNEM